MNTCIVYVMYTFSYEVCQDGYIDDLTKEVKKAQLVIRRGQIFKVKITLTDECSEDAQFRVISTIGIQFINHGFI